MDDATGFVAPGSMDMRGYPYLYITARDPTTHDPLYNTGVCVSKCPAAGETNSYDLCRNAERDGAAGTETKATCPATFVEETYQIEMFCFARADEGNPTRASMLASVISSSAGGAVFADIGRSWGSMILCTCFALLLSIGYIFLLSK